MSCEVKILECGRPPNSDSCVQRSIRIHKSWKIDHFSFKPNQPLQIKWCIKWPHILAHLTSCKLRLRNCGRDRQTLAPRFGVRHKTHYWISETNLENTIIAIKHIYLLKYYNVIYYDLTLHTKLHVHV